ncbi:MAG: hypothetical protein WKF84_29840 [Pyrinomonadaceae bacterium]
MGVEIQNTTSLINGASARLQSLASMAIEDLKANNLAERVATEAITSLGAQLCLVQRFSASGVLETIHINRRVDVSAMSGSRKSAHLWSLTLLRSVEH